jgi:hypothetical protein
MFLAELSTGFSNLVSSRFKQFFALRECENSGTIILNGQEYIAREEIPKVIHSLLKKLGMGH